MNRKKTFYTELAYVFGMVILAFGTALMERADFGVSMVVAPAYLLHLKLSQTWSFFTFGMAEYALQFVLALLLIVIMRKFKKAYVLAFVTAVLYGFTLDGTMLAVAQIPFAGTAARCVYYVAGMILCSLGVSLMFHTYIAPEVYELMVKEISGGFGWNIPRVKTVYDCISCLVAVLMSFIFFGFGRFEGVKLGTVICALLNGWIIGSRTKWLDKRFEFRDGLGMRAFFEH